MVFVLEQMFLQGRFRIWKREIPYFSLLLLVAFLLEHNRDEKDTRNTDVTIHVKLKVEAPIEIFLDHSGRKWPTQKFRPPQKILTHAEDFDPCKKNDPRNPRKMLTHVKTILTHVKHVTNIKNWPTHPRNLCYHVSHAI